MKYFKDCKTIEDAKKIYRELLKQYHPDHAGKEGEAETIEIIDGFNLFLDNFVSDSFDEYFADKEEKPDYSTVTPFQEALKKIIRLDCEIEIIGYWIYCFNSYSVHEYLKELGGGLIGSRVIRSFHAGYSRSRSRSWFSGKHKAWIYSGGRKSRFVTKATLDQLRKSKGNCKVEKEDTDLLFAV
jgi:curved DNA-binding protein CbpA